MKRFNARILKVFGWTVVGNFPTDKKYVVMPDIPYSASEQSSELSLKWKNCAKAIKDYSWRAIYAKADAEFNFHVSEMKKLCDQYGYDECVAWCEQEAAQMWELSQQK